MAKNVKSTVKLNMPRIKQLTRAATVTLEQTAEAIHTDVVQSRVMPRDTGALQNEKTFVDNSDASQGKVYLVSEGPYARRLYYHPEYLFQKMENPNAKGRWLDDYMKGGKKQDFAHKSFARLYKKNAGL